MSPNGHNSQNKICRCLDDIYMVENSVDFARGLQNIACWIIIFVIH